MNTARVGEEPKPTILVINQNVQFRESLTRFIQHDEQLTLLDAVSRMEEVLQRPAEQHPDVILLDLDAVDSFDAIAPLQSQFPSTHIIAMRIRGEERRSDALLAGAHAFLPKATLSDELAHTILRLTRR